jgi:hypothetical protein
MGTRRATHQATAYFRHLRDVGYGQATCCAMVMMYFPRVKVDIHFVRAAERG